MTTDDDFESAVDIVAKQMLHEVVTKLLHNNGWDEKQNPIEFDPNDPDSQYSILYDEILDILDAFNAETILCGECDDGRDLWIPSHICPVKLEIPNKEER